MSCHACGEPLPANSRFCPACGTAVVHLTDTARHKLVTVMFADVVESTSLGERTDAEVLQRMMAAHASLAREVIESNGGLVEKFIGDAVMAVFGVPTAHDDDAVRAVRAAFELRARAPLPLRIGVNSGEVFVAAPTVGMGTLSADALNTAARLEQLAPAHEIFLGQLTYRLVRDQVRVEVIEGLHARGKRAPLTAYRLIDVDRPGAVRRAAQWPLVGRDGELSQLRSFLDSPADGPGCRFRCVVGLPGIGKSRLVEALLASAASERTLYGRCLPYGQPSVLWPVAEAVRAMAGMGDDSSTEVALAQLRRLVASASDPEPLLQAVAAAIGLGSTLDRLEDGFWALRLLLEHLAEDSVVVLVIDDLQWADEQLLDFIDYLSARVSGGLLRIVGLGRPELLARRPAWTDGALKLEPLSDGAMVDLVNRILDHGEVPPVARGYIVDAAAGSPLFARELSRMLVDDGVLWSADGRWLVDESRLAASAAPPTITALLTARFDQLAPSARHVLAAASVIGESFGRRALSAMVHGTAVVNRELGQLALSEFVRPDPAVFVGDDGYRFTHVLVRDAVYASIPKSERARLHEALADWLSGVVAERQTEFDAIIAHHYDQTHCYRHELGEAERGSASARRAAAWLSQVGLRAWRQYDVASAARLLPRALALLPPGDPDGLGYLFECVEAVASVGDSALARAIIEEAESACGADDEIAQAWLELARHGAWTGMSSDDVRAWAVVRRESAVAAYETFERFGESRGQLLASSAIAQAASLLCRFGDAADALRDAARIARQLGDEALAYKFVASALWNDMCGPVALDEVSAGAVALGPPPSVHRASAIYADHLLGELASMTGRHAEAHAALAAVTAVHVDGGDTLGRGYLAVSLALAAFRAGDPDGARAVLEAVDGDLAQIGERSIRSSVCALLARALAATDRAETALDLAGAAEELCPSDLFTVMHVERARAAAHRALGDLETAAASTRRALDAVEQSDMLLDHAEVLLDHAEVLHELHRPAEALEALAQADVLARGKKSAVLDVRVAATRARITGARADSP